MRIIALILIVLIVLPIVSADEYYNAGITPDSSMYGLDLAMERMSLALSSKGPAKAEKRLNIATERLAELSALINKGNSQSVDELINENRKQMQLVEDAILTEKDAGKSVAFLERKIAIATYNHVLILEEVLGKVPLAGQSGLRNAIQESTKGNQRALSRLERETGGPAGIEEDLAKRRMAKK